MPNLQIFNPSPYARSGPISMLWSQIGEQTGMTPDTLELYDSANNRVPHQVDVIDPDDRSKDALVFSPTQPLPSGPDDYSRPSALIRIEKGESKLDITGQFSPKVLDERIELTRRLTMSFNFSPPPGPAAANQNWYSGAATSVRMGQVELLDVFKSQLGFLLLPHDPEKRALQIDRLRIYHPAWDTKPYQDVDLFDKSYRLVSTFSGPIRSGFTIAARFEYEFTDYLTGKEQSVTCDFYRVIAVYAEEDFVAEELFVKMLPVGVCKGKQGSVVSNNLNFEARYFAYVDMGLEVGSAYSIYRFPGIPSWFAVGSKISRYPGYGFACNVNVGAVVNPHIGFPKQNAQKSFSWEILSGNYARCLHLFMLDKPNAFDDLIGKHWYEWIYKPLKSTLEEI